MGTTTQAIQLVKYLKLMGYSAAYVEMNGNHYIDNLTTYYQVKVESDYIKYEDVELYRREKILAANKNEYDYLVKDYGYVGMAGFELVSFAEQDLRIITCGSKPNELPAVENILRDQNYEDIKYIFTFVPKDERPAIKEMMEEYAEKTFFVEYVPDPYVYLSAANNVCKAVLG